MENKHTAKTLAKYLGMSVYVVSDSSYDDPVDSGTYILDSLDLGDRYHDIGLDNPAKYSLFGKEVHAKDVYPILKTVDDLTYEDIESVFDSVSHRYCKANGLTMTFKNETLFAYRYTSKSGDYTSSRNRPDYFKMMKLLDMGFGAEKDEVSPTGFVSVHDLNRLPCIRWREDGVYSL
jgi:hypothetical protein